MQNNINPKPKRMKAEEGAALKAELDAAMDAPFISHIQAHLKPGQEVVCKICGKKALEICKAKGKEKENV
jgi:hypothetical protein